MKYEKKEIMKLIQKTVFEVTKIHVDNEKINLLDTSLDICPADFLYVFDLLEKELNISIVEILIRYPYYVMELDHMSDALLELLESVDSCTIQK